MSAERVVRYDPAFASAALFQPVFKGFRPRLDVRFDFNGIGWRWRGPEQLGIPEQTLLLVLLELAAEQKAVEPVDETRQIESDLYQAGEVRRPRTARLTVSFYELCRRLGRGAGGSATEQRRAELKRLCEVTVWSKTDDGTEFQSRLLNWEVGNGKGVTVVLNWRLTEVLFGGHFSVVCLDERLSLKSECARALHCALSLRIRAGMTMAFHIDKLAKYIWSDAGVHTTWSRRTEHRPESETPAAIAARRRSRELKKAVTEMAGLSAWTVKLTTNGAIQFSRHALTRVEETSRPWPPEQSQLPRLRQEASRSPAALPGVWTMFARQDSSAASS
ncbi:replication protein C, IncQ-type [Caballeronia sp. LZ043]|uniref:replication protein C, IncQ-type n=1 Tax=Caballeronia sp. LZ043 TaxID=3038569 RepID=UPI002855E242|nr:replication protein C, IncQ-type [Caballeronia sp. LZ043]MDR5819320.1 replication protein C, IncQ-type [Caballeronia sp. LZ043]